MDGSDRQQQSTVPAPEIRGDGLHRRRCRVADADVIWLRAVLEAYDGLASLYGDGSGAVSLTSTVSRARELDGLIEDLAREVAIQPLDRPG